MHTHDHSHSHAHSHGPAVLTSINRALIIGAVLNTVYVAVEFGMGLYYNSLALVADAGHNLSDVAGLLLSLLAFRLARVRQTTTFTYGYRKSTVLASLINAVVLLVTIGAILIESIQRFRHPEPVAGGPVAWVAALGIVINLASALLFFGTATMTSTRKERFCTWLPMHWCRWVWWWRALLSATPAGSGSIPLLASG